MANKRPPKKKTEKPKGTKYAFGGGPGIPVKKPKTS